MEEAFSTPVCVHTLPTSAPQLSWLKFPSLSWLLKSVTAFQSSATGPLSKLHCSPISFLKHSSRFNNSLYPWFSFYLLGPSLLTSLRDSSFCSPQPVSVIVSEVPHFSPLSPSWRYSRLSCILQLHIAEFSQPGMGHIGKGELQKLPKAKLEFSMQGELH